MGLWQRKKRKVKVQPEAVTITRSNEPSNMDSTKAAVLIEQGDEVMCNVSNGFSKSDASSAGALIPVGESDGIMLFYLPNIDGSPTSKVIFGVPIPSNCSDSSSMGMIQSNILGANSTNTAANKDVIRHDEFFIELLHPDSYILSTNTTPSTVHSTLAEFTTDITFNYTDLNANTDSLEHLIPNDRVNQAIFHTSIWLAKQIVHLSNQGAKLVKDQGEKWRSSQPNLTAIVLIIEEEQPQQTRVLGISNHEMKDSSSINANVCETDTSNIHVRNASYVWSCSKAIRNVVEYVSESISNVLGTMIGSCITEQPTDGKVLRFSRDLVRTTVVSCGEVGMSIEESFDIVTNATKEEVTSCVALYYGLDAATFTQHTLGTVINLMKAVITARRVLNAKKVAQFSIAKVTATSTVN